MADLCHSEIIKTALELIHRRFFKAVYDNN